MFLNKRRTRQTIAAASIHEIAFVLGAILKKYQQTCVWALALKPLFEPHIKISASERVGCSIGLFERVFVIDYSVIVHKNSLGKMLLCTNRQDVHEFV